MILYYSLVHIMEHVLLFSYNEITFGQDAIFKTHFSF